MKSTRTPTESALAEAEAALFAANLRRDPNRAALLIVAVRLREQYAREVNGHTLKGLPTLTKGALTAPLTVGPAPGERCLTIRQPWAALILLGIKPVENRRWFTKYRGRLWIHTAKKLGVRDWSEVFDLSMAGASLPALSSLPLGAIIGAADLYDCRDVDDLSEGCDAGFASGPVCWLLRDPRPLATPFPCPGALSLWTPPVGLKLALQR
jgi:ASCH domain